MAVFSTNCAPLELSVGVRPDFRLLFSFFLIIKVILPLLIKSEIVRSENVISPILHIYNPKKSQ